MEHQDNTFLMLVFLYPASSPSKGKNDVFSELKKLAIQLSEKYKNDGSRIAWVSVLLPEQFADTLNRDTASMLSSTYGNQEILSLAVIDLALRKIGPDSLVMLCSNSMSFKPDVLNRVSCSFPKIDIRPAIVYLNICQMFVFFRFEWAQSKDSKCSVRLVSSIIRANTRIYAENANHVTLVKVLAILIRKTATSFHSMAKIMWPVTNHQYYLTKKMEYNSFFHSISVRKSQESLVPIVRSDNYIETILHREDQSISNVLDLFIKSNTGIHVMRAIEPNLRFGRSIKNYLNETNSVARCEFWDTDQSAKCLRIASRKQIGDALIKFQNRQSNNVNIS